MFPEARKPVRPAWEAYIPPETSVKSRISMLSRIFPTARIGENIELELHDNSFIGDFTLITVPHLILGKGSQVNSGTRIVGRKPVQIGRDTTISYGCTLITSSDSTEAEYMNDAAPLSKRILREGPIGIGDNCFLGAHSIIMPGVQIVEGVVVRAFSYVNKDLLQNHVIYGGQPAVPLKGRRYIESL